MELCVKCCVCLCGVCSDMACANLFSPLRGIFGVPFFLGHQIIKTHFPLEAPLTPFSLHSLTHTLAQAHTHTTTFSKSLRVAPTGGCDEWPAVIECFRMKVEERLCHMQERPEGGNTSLQIHRAGLPKLQRWNRDNSKLACF